MQIYLVRHGETAGNLAHRHQATKTRLTKAGEAAAIAAGEDIKQYQPTHLLTSNLIRAVETARVLGTACNLVPETDERFVELVRPVELYGHHHRSLRSLFFYARWYFGLTDPKAGESYRALRQRFQAVQEYLATYPKDARIVVVSHAVFINLFAAHLCSSKPLWLWQAARTFLQILRMPNLHVVSIQFDPDSKQTECAWSVDRPLET